MKHRMPVIIGIAGGTGSGKSTFTNRLKDEFKDQVTVIYHDNYYRATTNCPSRSASSSTTTIRMPLRPSSCCATWSF